jgi:nucleoside-diphosphate kinase
MTNLTLTIIKPDSYEKGNDQLIAARFIQEGFKPIAMKYKYLSPNEAKQFYDIHKDKPFFKDLIVFMTSGPIVVYALEKEDAVKKFRTLIGDTDPTKAEPGSIRSIYGTDIAHNAIHGSDSNENAAKEILFFFPELQSKVIETK